MTDLVKFARPYALAAFEYATEHQEVAAWSKMLQELSVVVAQPAIKNLLDNPHYSQHTFAEIIIDLVPSLTTAGKNFVNTLAHNDRLKTIPAIAELYEQHRALAEKTMQVHVQSVVPLDKELQQELKKVLEKKLDKQIHVNYETETDLLGGMVIRMGDHVIDASIRGQLTRLREQLLDGN